MTVVHPIKSCISSVVACGIHLFSSFMCAIDQKHLIYHLFEPILYLFWCRHFEIFLMY